MMPTSSMSDLVDSEGVPPSSPRDAALLLTQQHLASKITGVPVGEKLCFLYAEAFAYWGVTKPADVRWVDDLTADEVHES